MSDYTKKYKTEDTRNRYEYKTIRFRVRKLYTEKLSMDHRLDYSSRNDNNGVKCKNVTEMNLLRLVMFSQLTLHRHGKITTSEEIFAANQQFNETNEQHWLQLCVELENDCELKIKTPAELEVSKFTPTITDLNLRDREFEEEETTVILVLERKKPYTDEKTHGKGFMSEVKKKNAIQTIHNRNKKATKKIISS